MNNLELTVSKKDLNSLFLRLDAIRKDSVIQKSLKDSGFYLQRWIKNNRLTGPRPTYLGVVSGRLKSSISVSDVNVNNNEYSVDIGTNVKYARKHEFGFVGREQVREHIRRLRERVSFKRWVAKPGSLVAEEKRLTRSRFSGFQYVRAHTRSVNVRERPFLRPALESRTNQLKILSIFLDRIRKALDKK